MHEAIGHGFEPHGVHINSNVFFFQVLLHLVVRINSNAFFFQMLLHLVPGATTGTKYKSIYTGRYRLPLKALSARYIYRFFLAVLELRQMKLIDGSRAAHLWVCLVGEKVWVLNCSIFCCYLINNI